MRISGLYLFQETLPVFLVTLHVDIVVDHIDGHERPVQLGIARHDGKTDQPVSILFVFHGHKDALVIIGDVF